MDDTYSVKLQVDSSDLSMAAQQAQMIAMNSAISAGQIGLNPVANMVQQSMVQQMQGGSSFNSMLVNPISMGTGNPFQHMGMGNITTPQGYIAGTPMGPEPSSRAAGNIGAGVIDLGVRKFVNSSMGNFLQNYFPSVGFLGLSGGGDLNTPVYRANQMFVEKFAESIDTVKANAWYGAGLGAIAAGGWAGIKYGLGGPASIAAFAAGQTMDYAFNVREKYMDIGRYYRDATASVYRDKLGGGASAEKAAELMRGFSKTVAKDDYLMRDDYQLLLQAGTELNAFASNRSPDDTIRALKNIASTVKTLSAVGVHLKDMQQDLGVLVQMGLDPSRNNFQNARFLGGMGMNAFSANMTTQQMLMASAQGSPIYAGMGIAPQIGAMVHSQSLATSGEAIRSGVFGISDQAYYGGQQGIAAANTRTSAALTGSPLGMAFTLAAMRNKGMEQGMVKGTVGVEELLNSNTLNMDPSTYANLLYKLPQYTKDMDPTMFGMGQVGAMAKSLSQTLGRKLTAGEMQQILVRQGVSPDDARVTMNQIEHADEIGGAQFESLVNKQKQRQFEIMRPPANIFTNPRLFAQKITERIFEKPISAWAADNMESMGGWEEWMEGSLFDKIIHPEKEHVYKIAGGERGVEGVKMWGNFYKQDVKKQAKDSAEVVKAREQEIIKNYRVMELETYRATLINLKQDNVKELYEKGDAPTAEEIQALDNSVKKNKYLTVSELEKIQKFKDNNGGILPASLHFILQKAMAPSRTSYMNLPATVPSITDKQILKTVQQKAPIWENMRYGLEEGLEDTNVGFAVEKDLSNVDISVWNAQAAEVVQAYGRGGEQGENKMLNVLAKKTYGDDNLSQDDINVMMKDPTFVKRQGARLHHLQRYIDEPAVKAGMENIEKTVLKKSTLSGTDKSSKDVEKDYKALQKAYSEFGYIPHFGSWWGGDPAEFTSGDNLTPERLSVTRAVGMSVYLQKKKTQAWWQTEGAYDPTTGSSEEDAKARISTVGELKKRLSVDDPLLKQLTDTSDNSRTISDEEIVKLQAANARNLQSKDANIQNFKTKLMRSVEGKDVNKFLIATRGGAETMRRKFDFSKAYELENMVSLIGSLGGNQEVGALLSKVKDRGSMSEEEAAQLMQQLGNAKSDSPLDNALRQAAMSFSSLSKGSDAAQVRKGFMSSLAAVGLTGKQAKEEVDVIMDNYQGEHKNAAAAMSALGAITQQVAGGEVITGNKGKFLNSEQQAGLRQASRDVSNMIQLTSSISSSIEKVPDSLNKFRTEFMEEFRVVANNIVEGRKSPAKVPTPGTKESAASIANSKLANKKH